MTQTLPLSSQGDINAGVDELQRAASATTAQPQLHFRPYRSSLLRAPTKDLVQVDPEGAELLAPVFGHGEDAPLEADLTIGTGSGTPVGERLTWRGRVLDSDGNRVVQVARVLTSTGSHR